MKAFTWQLILKHICFICLLFKSAFTICFSTFQKKLDNAIMYRQNVQQRLDLSVLNLDQLNSTLHLLEELDDMGNQIDEIYLPIETMYAKLR